MRISTLLMGSALTGQALSRAVQPRQDTGTSTTTTIPEEASTGAATTSASSITSATAGESTPSAESATATATDSSSWWSGPKLDPSKYQLGGSNGTQNATNPFADLPDNQQWQTKPTFDHKCGQGISLPAGRDWVRLDDIDQCPYPDRSKYAPVGNPPSLSATDEIVTTVGDAWWTWLRMDEWLTDAIEVSCPQAADVYTDGATPEERDKINFSTAFGRYMLGRIDEDVSNVDCGTSLRCNWAGVTQNGYSCRGYTSGQNSNPDFANEATEDRIESWRRWYALQAMGNIWDFYTASKDTMSQSMTIFTPRITQLLSKFSMTFEPDLPAQRPCLLSDILDVISAVAMFTPFGPEIAMGLQIEQILFSGAAGDVPAATKSANKLAGQSLKYDGLGPNGRKNAHGDATADAKAAAIINARKGIAHNVAHGVELASSIAELVHAAGEDEPEQDEQGHWVSSVSVEFGALSGAFASVFAGIISNMDQASSAALNGDPKADGGYLSMVTGGLFAYQSNSNGASAISADNVDSARKVYVAYLEDELLKMIFKAQGAFVIRRDFASMDDCQAASEFPQGAQPAWETTWDGIVCVPQDDDTAIQYMPFVADVGIGHTSGSYFRPTIFYMPQFFQTYPQFAQLADSLRMPYTEEFTFSMTEFYTAIDRCSQQTVQPKYDASVASGTPATCDGSQTSPLGVWPQSFTPADAAKDAGNTFGIPLNKLSETCHWNIPLLKLDDNLRTGCAADSRYKNPLYRGDSPCELYCNTNLLQYDDGRYPTYLARVDAGVQSYYTNGAGLNYARSLLVPRYTTCGNWFPDGIDI